MYDTGIYISEFYLTDDPQQNRRLAVGEYCSKDQRGGGLDDNDYTEIERNQILPIQKQG
ncbi:MAG: hypothetical protein M0R39_03820 [Prolixibacteraceae bacterium]|nr:hypothetical protein [Prolixibacteraceae bacterium]